MTQDDDSRKHLGGVEANVKTSTSEDGFMALTDALAIIAVHGHGLYLSNQSQALLHDARVIVVKHVQDFTRARNTAEQRERLDDFNR